MEEEERGHFTLTRGRQDSRAETLRTAAKPKPQNKNRNRRQRANAGGGMKLNQEKKKKEYKTRKIEGDHHRYRKCLGVLREEKEQFFLQGLLWEVS